MWDWHLDASNMVDEQIVGRGVSDSRVLRAMLSVPRHLFVPEKYVADAYIDRPLPIGELQTISQPYMVAKMSELLETEEGMSVLEIGTGSGYQSAILAALGLSVWSIERISTLAETAKSLFQSLGLNISVIHSDGSDGFAAAAPYDRIIVTAAVDRVEDAWESQLAPQGLLVVPLNVTTGGQRLLVREKLVKGDGFIFEDTWYDYCRFVPLIKGIV